MKKVLLSLVVIAGLAFGTTSCSKAKDAANKTVEATKKAANTVGDAAKHAADKTADLAKDGANAVVDGVKKAGDAVKNAVVDTKQVAAGKVLFTSKTCTACHAADKKVVGPSIKDIVKKYEETGGNIVKFLKGNSEAIVDTDPAQVAMMKANLTGILKGIKAEELQAITAYMRSVAK